MKTQKTEKKKLTKEPLLHGGGEEHEQETQELEFHDCHKKPEGPLLSRIDTIHSSKEYLEECTYFIGLKEIYELKSSCYYHEEMEYCPVLVEIKSPDIKRNKNCNYLLQVWKKDGKKVYEKPLQDKVTLWTVSYAYFLFKPSSKDENSNYLHLVHLSDKNQKFVTYANSKVYIASDKTIKVAKVHHDEAHVGKFQDDLHSFTIDIGSKANTRILGLFMTHFEHKIRNSNGELVKEKETQALVALETKDQQIDMNQIIIDDHHHSSINSENHEFSYKLIQYREIIPRKKYIPYSDEIEQFKCIFKHTDTDNIMIAVVKRKSKEFDFYYSGQRVYTSHEVKVREVDISFEKILLVMDWDLFTEREKRQHQGIHIDDTEEDRKELVQDEEVKKTALHIHEMEQRVRTVDLKWETKISYENSVYIDHYEYDEGFFTWRIKKHCKIFKSFCLVGTVLLVAHGNIISLFSILSSKWQHFFYNQEIVDIFRGGHNEITALFADQTIKVIKQQKISNTGEDQEPWVEDKTLERKLKDKIVDYHQDREDNKWIIFVTRKPQVHGEKDEYGLFALYEHELYDITSDFPEEGFHAKPNVVFLFSVNEHTEFIVQHHHSIDLYTIDFEEIIPEEELNKSQEIEEDEKKKEEEEKDDDSDEDKAHIEKVVEVKKAQYEMRPVVRAIQSIDVSEHNEHDAHVKSKINKKISDGVKFQLHEAGKHHSKPKHYLFLSDTLNFYQIELFGNFNVTTMPDQNCMGIYFSDQNYLYTISQSSSLSNSRLQGLRLYDIENVIEKKKDYSYLLTASMQVGCQGHIDFSHENERIIFLTSYENIEVIPLLHRNTSSFIGMKPRNNYLATKVIDGKFIALSNKGKLYTWDLITGKLLSNPTSPLNPLKQQQLKKYKDYEVYACADEDDGLHDTVYKKEWYSKILLKKKTEIKDFDYSQYKGHGGIDESLPNQISYNQRIEKKFYEFVIIEITSSEDVVEHLSFFHPVYPGIMQFIYFSDDLKYLYERLKYERHFLYERQFVENGKNRVNWNYIHRFQSLPVDLLNATQFPYIFSPNFTKYLDVDESHTRIYIRNTLDHESIIKIFPKQYADGKRVPLEETMRRLRWLDEDKLHIINEEGIERIIDTTNDFQEIEFNFIPLYDKEICKKQHYLLDAPSYKLAECLKTLQKRYQQYKSAYNLRKNIDKDYNLYQEQFYLDYRIDNCEGQFETDMSFSFLHWSLVEQLHSGKITIDQIDTEQVHLLFYNIFPHGNTVLHKLHDNGDLMEQLLKIAHPNPEDISQIQIHIPFIRNMDGDSPIHLCVKAKEYRYINVMLECLSAYPIDHHSRAIYDTLPVMIEHALPNFIPYLESRVRQTELAAKITKGMLKETNTHSVCATSLWIGKDAIDSLFQPAPIEQDVRLQFVDIPQYHSFVSKAGIEFFHELSNSEDMRLFETTAVKKLIEFQWPLILKYSILKLFIPFVIFQIFYLIYMHVIFGSNRNDLSVIETVLIFGSQGILTFFAVYLAANEVTQLFKQSFEYFLSVWNYLDIIPPVMIIVFMALDYTDYFIEGQNIEMKASMQAIMSLFIWLKFLYFLRIFDSTGYLIRIIIQVGIDMRHFLLILLLTFVAFGDAIYNINASNEIPFYEGGFFGGIAFVYRMVLGDFATDQFGDVALPLMWILFILCTVFNMIIMLNLLIAIISESFAAVNEVSKQASYQEKARIISENLYLVPDSARESFCAPNTYLLMAIDTEQELQENSESIDNKLKTLRKKILEANNKQFEKLEKRIKKQGENMMRMAGLPAGGLSQFGGSKYGGSKYGGSVHNFSHNQSHGGHHH